MDKRWGWRQAVSRKGRVVLAYELMDKGRKDGVKSCGRGRVVVGVTWARKDSRPEEKAKEPRGRAESERRSRWWRDGGGDGWESWWCGGGCGNGC